MLHSAFGLLFGVGAGDPFNFRCDKLDGGLEPVRVAFQRRVPEQVMGYLEQGIPERPARFIKELQNSSPRPYLKAAHLLLPESLT